MQLHLQCYYSFVLFCMQDGYTPLHGAAIEGKAEAIKALIEQGADIDSTTDVSCYPDVTYVT